MKKLTDPAHCIRQPEAIPDRRGKNKPADSLTETEFYMNRNVIGTFLGHPSVLSL